MLVPYQWKNKGILVPVYAVTSVFGTAMLLGILQRNFGGSFNKVPMAYGIAFGLLVAGIWTYLTCESYYKDNEGNKKKLEVEHQFYWIKMKYWAYIYWGIAALIIIDKLSD